MVKEIPKVLFNETKSQHIEVLTFSQLVHGLNQSENHSPYAAHKIEFYLILVVTENTYTHFVDFKSYTLKKGSTLFIAKNQVHHFTKSLQLAAGFCIIFSSEFTDKHHFLSSSLKLNRLFNYHIETPVIHQNELGDDSFIGIAQTLHKEYNFKSNFAKAEMLITLLQLLLLKAERAKEFQSVSGIKNHWLETFTKFKNKLEQEYVNTRNARDYASDLIISYKFLNDIVKKLTGKTAKAFIDDFVTTEIKRYQVNLEVNQKVWLP